MISEEITAFLMENRCEIDRVTIEPEVGEMMITFCLRYGLSIERHTGNLKIIVPVIVVKPIHQERIIFAFDRIDSPMEGEYYVDNLGKVRRAAFDYSSKYPIYKIEGE